MRILGLDYGEKRIGVAVCDELGITAHGLPTIIRKTKRHDLEVFANLIKDYNIEKIVIGYPVRIDGSEGIQCDKVNRFAALLDKTFSLPLIKWPETLSTKEAEEILINFGVSWRKRKKEVDKLAACIILQSYLDSSGKETIN
ncbi:MAG: Holliday junction resolvase RuvX [Smithella sp.]